jgi:transcription-repair coupling factor (superfamily II helicase)
MVEGTKDKLQPFWAWIESEARKRWRRIGLTGLRGSSKAYLLSRWREKTGGTILVVVPDMERAEAFYDDLLFFQRDGGTPISIFPPWETLPYDEIPPHPEIIRDRVRNLFSVLSGEAAVVISPVRALMQRVLPPLHLKRSVFSLSVGAEVQRDRLVDYLLQGGYGQVKVVEERGEFSLRGGIIDIYSPLYEEPLRLEFDGDRLESVRRFETETQRSVQDGAMKEVFLLPARDAPSDPLRGSMATFFDYWTGNGIVFVDSWEEIKKEAETFSRLVGDHYERALKKGISPPSPESTYIDFEKITVSFDRVQTVLLEENPLAPPEVQDLFPFEMAANEDLRREMKATFSAEPEPGEASPFSVLLRRVRGWRERGMSVFVVSHTSGQAERLRDLFSHYEMASRFETEKSFMEVADQGEKHPVLLAGPLSTGFRNPYENWVLLTEEEIFGERRRLRERKKRGGPFLSSLRELRENDFIVHVDYGIGIYRGLKHLNIWGVSNDYLLLEYQDGDKLYVPVDRLNLIQHYAGGDGKPPGLDKLGSGSWQRTKRKVKAAIEEVAKELLDLYAARQAFEGFAFPPPDQFYREFEATFEYEETPDQTRAIEEVMKDLGNPRVMDRLICGDVGYGKTEVAIRASYRTVMGGKQVAVLVPTTVLAQQHHQTFRDRFKTYPVVIEVLSRFKSPREQREILQRVKEGKVDIVIGTHRLLQKDVAFRDLGLVVVDEEHRFGVSHKEKLKQLRKLVDVMTLTATPIPRTLQMAISGIRDLSLIQTAPENRLAIRTLVVRYDDEVVREAILREFQRGGQVFFVHNRVQNIYVVAAHLKRLLPEASLAVAHGQMKEKELEKVMLQFVRREYNLLVCTSIIESGLDIPSANTILINHAERFGLADLYQLRGRVGRGSHQAYAYLLIPGELALSRDALKRLRAIQELSELGAGFKLALHDLEIRGAGNLLGSSQSGHVQAVGFEYYTHLMEKAIKEMRGEEVIEEITPEIHFHLPAFIPENYVEEPAERLSLYRRLSFSRSDEDVEKIRQELTDRFGKIPEEAENLIEVIHVKILLTRLSIRKFEETPSSLVITFDETTKVSPEKVLDLVRRGKGRYRLTPDSRLVVDGWRDTKKDPFGAAKDLLQALA